jgi:hypothetical protein
LEVPIAVQSAAQLEMALQDGAQLDQAFAHFIRFEMLIEGRSFCVHFSSS